MEGVQVSVVLARVEHVSEFPDVPVALDRNRQPLAFDRRREARDEECGDLVEVG